jgi:hypothetical protein
MRLRLPFFNRQKGADAEPVLSDEQSLVVQPYGGRWYHAAKQGRVFTGNDAAAGQVLPIYSATAQKFGIWNPPGSGVNGVLVGLRGTYIDTTGAAGGYCLGLLRNVPAVAGTASPISAFTETAPERGLLGNDTGGNKIKFGLAITVTTALMVIGRQLGINQTVLTATDATNLFSAFKEDFDGDLVLKPGNALFVCGNIATLCKLACSLTWAEEPI